MSNAWKERRDDFPNLVHLHVPFSSVPLPLTCLQHRSIYVAESDRYNYNRFKIILPFHDTARSHADDRDQLKTLSKLTRL